MDCISVYCYNMKNQKTRGTEKQYSIHNIVWDDIKRMYWGGWFLECESFKKILQIKLFGCLMHFYIYQI